MTHPLRVLAILCAVLPGVAFAQDVVVTPGPGGGFVVQDDTGGFERLRVDEQTGYFSKEGQVFLHSGGTNTYLGEATGNLPASAAFGANTAVGYHALDANLTGAGNSAFGYNALGENTAGTDNAAFGRDALESNVSGSDNSAFGYDALQLNVASFNSAFGRAALSLNTTGEENAAFGWLALTANVTGSRNAAFGYRAGWFTTASDNSAFGADSMGSNTSGTGNAAFGSAALGFNTTASGNSAFGFEALRENTTGAENVAMGKAALSNNASGHQNVAIGTSALAQINGTHNVAIGYIAGSVVPSGDNNTYVNNAGPLGAESNTIRIGNNSVNDAFIGGIFGNTSSSGVAVFVNSSDELGTLTSSGRFKQDVRDMGEKSELLMKLRPVTFRYREGVADDAQLVHFGLIAEEVAAIDPGLVSYDEEGDPYSVRYQFLAPMLVNEAQQQRRVIAEQRAQIDDLTARLERLEALLESQRVASR